ncbi:hypothetical protein BO99DRAFT_23820 [Aspergillus violaceofuscus CBS 115571]|uniref:Uncharacterized protein n=1 Tax=Aspergillus violaceofuscus (strain CBS 115571) TaxID=1450538 RepID=A0A2V5GU14_ASPV1|nr:hypothetical protein BO99DRAFT_23820 [Aspergillus violaceofuscus CBS 115571]
MVSGLALDGQDDARGDGLQDHFRVEIHCFMSTLRFLLCTFAYAIPCSRLFPIPHPFRGLVLLLLFIFGTLFASSTHFSDIAYPRPSFLDVFPFYSSMLFSCCVSCQSEVLPKSERKYYRGSNCGVASCDARIGEENTTIIN